MSDAELRELERRVAAGETEAEAHLLRARVRAGDLDSERLALAAFLGDPASREAQGKRGPVAPLLLRRLLERLDRDHGREAFLRGCVSLLRFDDREPPTGWLARAGRWLAEVVEAGLSLGPYNLEGTSASAVEALEAWLLCPCRGCAAAADGSGRGSLAQAEAGTRALASWLTGATDGREQYYRERIVHFDRACGEVARVPRLGQVDRAIEALTEFFSSDEHEWHRQRTGLEVIPWALGLRDPVVERAGRGAGGEGPPEAS